MSLALANMGRASEVDYRMSRFHFRYDDGELSFGRGVDLPSLAAARHEAVKEACAKIQEAPDEFWANGGDWRMVVTDERGLTLFMLTFYATNAPVTSFDSSCKDGGPVRRD